MPKSPKAPDVPEQLRPVKNAAASSSVASPNAQALTVGGGARHLEYLRDIWQHREFAYTLSLAQIESRNEDTMLGKAWYLLNPLLLVGIYYLIFQVILGIESRRGVDDYLPFLTVGIISYTYTRSTVQAGANSVRKARRLVQSMRFPRALLPIASVISQSLVHLWAVGPMFVLILFMDVTPSLRWLFLPVVLTVHAALNLGLVLFAARFTFEFPDFSNLLPFLLRLGLYASGVLIPVNAELITSDPLRWTMQASPVYAVIEMTRQVVLGTAFDPIVWLVGIGWTAALLIPGYAYFRSAEERYSSV